MEQVVVSIAVLLFQAAQVGNQSKPLTAQEIYAKWSKSVVTIKAGAATGSGFFDSAGNLYTAYHVVRGAPQATVRFIDGKEVSAYWYVHLDPLSDIAVLQTEVYSGWQTREVGPKLADYAAVRVGESVVVVGSPLGLDGTITEGLVSAKRELKDKSLLQMSASVSPGSSGSPVFNLKGEVIGMVTSALSEGSNLNFAVSSRDLKNTSWVPMAVVAEPKPGLPGPEVAARSLIMNSKPTPKVELAPFEGISSVYILVEDLSDALKDSISRTDIEAWATAVIAPTRLKVVSVQEQTTELLKADVSTEEQTLRAQDTFRTTLYIRISGMKDVSRTTSYHIDVELTRGVFVYPGRFMEGTVWSKGYNGLFGSAYGAYATIRTPIQELVQRFVDLWSLANPPK